MYETPVTECTIATQDPSTGACSARIGGENLTAKTAMKSVGTSVAALAAIVAGAVGVTSIAFVPASPAQVQLAAVGAPMPQDPPPPLPVPA
jgi:hypothetical protein